MVKINTQAANAMTSALLGNGRQSISRHVAGRGLERATYLSLSGSSVRFLRGGTPEGMELRASVDGGATFRSVGRLYSKSGDIERVIVGNGDDAKPLEIRDADGVLTVAFGDDVVGQLERGAFDAAPIHGAAVSSNPGGPISNYDPNASHAASTERADWWMDFPSGG